MLREQGQWKEYYARNGRGNDKNVFPTVDLTAFFRM